MIIVLWHFNFFNGLLYSSSKVEENGHLMKKDIVPAFGSMGKQQLWRSEGLEGVWLEAIPQNPSLEEAVQDLCS